MEHWSVVNNSRGRKGDPGGSSTVSVGAVSTGAPGSSATVVNVGTPSAATLNFSIPRGNPGTNGSNGTNGTNGSSATIAVGSTTTGAPGSTASVTNVGTPNAATLNFTIPRGDAGGQGPAGPAIVSPPVAVTPAFGTAYAATVPTKPSFISAMVDTAYTVTVVGTQADTVELRIGPVQAQVASGTGGTAVATFRASITGIALVIGMGIGQRNQLSAWLPTGWFWSLRRVAGTTATITSATDQALG